MVEQLNRDHPDSIFVYANTYHVLGDILNNPARYRKQYLYIHILIA